MELLLITILLLVSGYITFVLVFPRALPNEAEVRTRQLLQQIHDESTLSVSQGRQDEVSNLFKEENIIVKGFYGLPIFKKLYPKLLRAGLREYAAPVFVSYLFLSALLMLAGLELFSFGVMSLFLGPVAAYFGVAFFLERKNKKRNEAFLNTFPDVLDMFVRSLKSGFPVTTAFRMVADNMEPPASTEFKRIVQELALGQSMQQVLNRLALRISEPDVHFFVVVMKVQQETGGNLAEVITNLSQVIRGRKLLRLKVKALTSEGRMTSYILGALPVVVFLALYAINPEYLEILWTSAGGLICLGLAAGLIVSCMLVINRLVDIDI